MLPTSTTNITGFLAMLTGFNFRTELTSACRTIVPLINECRDFVDADDIVNLL
jgi:hypothetical protein